MELQFTSIPLLLSFLLFIFMAFKIAKKTKSKTFSPKLPPGPQKLPLIGNLHQLAVSGSLPHHTLRKMAEKYGPLMHLKLGEVTTIIVTSAEIAREVLKTHDIIFAQRPFLLASRILSYDSTNIVFSPYGDYWRLMRKVCVMELLSSKRVQTFQRIREEEVLNLISKYQEEFISNLEEATALAAGLTIVDMYPSVKLLEVITGFRRKLEKIHEKLSQILESIVRDHKERRTTESGKGEKEPEDLVDVLQRIQKQGDLEFPLTDDNIKAVLLLYDYKGTDFEYIPFGAGRRICPGMSFALPNMALPLAQFLYHFDWKLGKGIKAEELDMEERFGLFVRRNHDLYLTPIPYSHLSSVE